MKNDQINGGVSVEMSSIQSKVTGEIRELKGTIN
jgi:hypothetical protein